MISGAEAKICFDDARTRAERGLRRFIVLAEGRPVLGGKGPAAGDPGVGTKRGSAPGAKHLRMLPVSVGQTICDEAGRRE
jgi:hypothetical protein